MKRFEIKTPDKLTDEEIKTVESLLNYPSLEKAFDQKEPQNIHALKQKMLSTVAELERVVRRGVKTDAEKAARIIEAYQTTIDFLEELERLRKSQTE